MAAIVLCFWFVRIITFLGLFFWAAGIVPSTFFQKKGDAEQTVQVTVTEEDAPEERVVTLRPPRKGEHWIGPVDASVVLIVYTDLDSCINYCMRFHQALLPLLDAQDPPMAVVYRYRKINLENAVMRGAMCLAEELGPLAFAEFFDLMSMSPAQLARSSRSAEIAKIEHLELFEGRVRAFPDEYLPPVMRMLGSNPETFAACMSSGRHVGRILRDTAEAKVVGVYAIPYAFVLNQKTMRGVVVVGMGDSTPQILQQTILQVQNFK